MVGWRTGIAPPRTRGYEDLEKRLEKKDRVYPSTG